MSGTVLVIDDMLLEPDQLATRIANFYIQWDLLRQQKIRDWTEVQRYVFATDTNKTTNSKLPWSNKTTIPKLCQIRDNLFANYIAAMFPRKKSIVWEGADPESQDPDKVKAIEQYMNWAIDRNEFYDEINKLVLDYIDYGNCIATVDWYDGTVDLEETALEPPKVGYVGPTVRRINPVDIVINPTAPDFARTPKLIQSFVSLGEVKTILDKDATTDDERKEATKIYEYLKNVRLHVSNSPGNLITKDQIYAISGFTSYRMYLESNYCEVLTFYGDIYDEQTDTLLRNQIIKIVDRHKIISKKQNPSYFGTAPIYHAGWRIRPDNLWAMGPLDNLVGMQYRIDHLENMKADVFDLIAYPPLKVKGYVEDFNWGPFERIYIGDNDGDVELMSPDVKALQADNQIALLEQKMEEMAGSPKEAMGFRTPGEKTAYEVQRLENAASRIFQNKIAQFERQLLEPLLNAMLELARRRLDPTTIRIFNSDLKVATFQELSIDDITGNGRLRPFAARHYAEKAIQIQNINNFFTSALGHDPSVLMHFSTVALSKMVEELLELQDSHIVLPFVRIAEQAQAQQLMQISQEQGQMQAQTAGGITPGDHDPNAIQPLPPAKPTNNPSQMAAQPEDSRTAKLIP